MIQIAIAIALALLFQLAIIEGISLGIAWLINTVADANISYGIVTIAAFVLWLIPFVIKALALYGVYKEGRR
jgi:hypothetical protein